MSDLDVKCLVSDEDDRLYHEWSSSSSSSSSSPWSSSYSASPSCSALTNNEGLSPDEEGMSSCALQTVSMETKQHLESKRKRREDDCEAEMHLFSEKRSKLQCFVPPLSSILQSLQSGRYSQRLSSFQESLAMDRIQRILGVLQNPETGSRFLHILLIIEEMLQKWFPHIRPTPSQTDEDAPTKRMKHQEVTTTTAVSSTHLLWLHTSPTCSVKTPDVSPSERATSSCCSNVMQDNVVSSTTDSFYPQKHTKLRSISSPCLERLLQGKESITPLTDGAETTLQTDGWTDES